MKRLSYLQSALQIFPSSLIYSQQSRPLNKQRRAEKRPFVMYSNAKDIAHGVVIQTGLIWGFKINIFFKSYGGLINRVRILKLGLERDGQKGWPQASKQTFNGHL